jgi:hypothetical protein
MKKIYILLVFGFIVVGCTGTMSNYIDNNLSEGIADRVIGAIDKKLDAKPEAKTPNVIVKSDLIKGSLGIWTNRCDVRLTFTNNGNTISPPCTAPLEMYGRFKAYLGNNTIVAKYDGKVIYTATHFNEMIEPVKTNRCLDTRDGNFDPSYSPAVCNSHGYFWCSIAKKCLDKPINVNECGEIGSAKRKALMGT